MRENLVVFFFHCWWKTWIRCRWKMHRSTDAADTEIRGLTLTYRQTPWCLHHNSGLSRSSVMPRRFCGFSEPVISWHATEMRFKICSVSPKRQLYIQIFTCRALCFYPLWWVRAFLKGKLLHVDSPQVIEMRGDFTKPSSGQQWHRSVFQPSRAVDYYQCCSNAWHVWEWRTLRWNTELIYIMIYCTGLKSSPKSFSLDSESMRWDAISDLWRN